MEEFLSSRQKFLKMTENRNIFDKHRFSIVTKNNVPFLHNYISSFKNTISFGEGLHYSMFPWIQNMFLKLSIRWCRQVICLSISR